MGRIAWIMGFALALVVALPGVGSAGSPGRLEARLGGKPLPLSRVATLHCHDFDHPIIRCYRSPAALERAVRARLAPRSEGPGPAALVDLAYVRIFADAGYMGASAYLSASYDNLGVIGWNDRISSFRSVNLGVGAFFEHVDRGGDRYSFCCNTNVSNVGSAYNDSFSSVTGTT